MVELRTDTSVGTGLYDAAAKTQSTFDAALRCILRRVRISMAEQHG